MSDDTTRPVTTGGDVIRADELLSEETGLVTSKAQAMKVVAGRSGVDGGFVAKDNGLSAGADEARWIEVGTKLALVAERFERRASLNRRRGGGSMLNLRPTVSAPNAWTPLAASVATLVWYRADLGVTQSGGLVSDWLDQSNAGDSARHQSSSGASKPAYVASDAAYGNRPVLTFDGTQSMVAAATFSSLPVVPLTFLIIGQGSSSSFLADLPLPGGTDNMVWSNASPFAQVYGSGSVTGTSSVAGPSCIMVTDDGTGGASAAKVFVGNLTTEQASGTTTWITAGATLLNIAKGNAGVGLLNGKLAEVIVWSGVLSAPDRASLVTYLNVTRGYGLGVT